MASNDEENMSDRLETANINYHDLLLQRNVLEKLYNLQKETSELRNKQVENLRINCQDQKTIIYNLLDQEEQYLVLEKEYSALLEKNQELKEKLVEAEKELECSLNVLKQKDTMLREHKKKVTEQLKRVELMDLIYKDLNKSHAETVQEYKEKLSKLEETFKRLREEVNRFIAVNVLTKYYEGPKFQEYEAVLTDVINRVMQCATVPRCKVTGQQFLDLYVKIGEIFSKIDTKIYFSYTT